MAYRRGPIGPLALIAIGALLLLRNLGYLPASLDQWWPAILIVLGLWILFARSKGESISPAEPGPGAPSPGQPVTETRRHAPTGGLILIGLGLALLVSNLLGGRGAGPLIIIAIGLALLIGRIW